MKINTLIELLQELKNNQVKDIFLERASIVENVANDFRKGYIWLDGYDCNGRYTQSIEIEIKE